MIEYTEVLPGEGWYAIAKRLGGSQASQAVKDRNANYLAAANGSKDISGPLYPNQIVWFNRDKLAMTPVAPANTLAALADRIAADRVELLARWASEITDERRTIIHAAVDEQIADVHRVCDVLRGHGIDPATIGLDGFDDTAEIRDVFGKQNLEPGSVHRNVRFHDQVEHRGSEADAPVVYLNCEHVGNGGDLFKLYGDVAPTIMINVRVRPNTPAAGVNAIRAHHASLFAVVVEHTVDAFWPMDNRDGKRDAAWFAYLCAASNLSWFAQDYHPDGSHCDAVQWPFSARVRWYRCNLLANVAPEYGKPEPWGNASWQLGAGKSNTDLPGDWFDMACTFGGGTSGWNLSASRPLTGPVMSLGSTWQPTKQQNDGDTVDVILPSHLNDGRIHLVGARKASGEPIRIRNWG